MERTEKGVEPAEKGVERAEKGMGKQVDDEEDGGM